MKAKQEYIDALECITKEYYSTVRSPEETNKFNSYLRLFKGLVNEHFEEKQETNFEHYEDEIATVDFDFAVRNGKVIPCTDCRCGECYFNKNVPNCNVLKIKWMYKQYERSAYKLTQFEHDLIKAFDHCKEWCLLNEIECLKKLIEKGYFKDIDPFTKVHDIIDNCEVVK